MPSSVTPSPAGSIRRYFARGWNSRLVPGFLALAVMTGCGSSGSTTPSDPCQSATISITEPQDGQQIGGVVTVRGHAETGCATNRVWLFDHPMNTHSYYVAWDRSLPVSATGNWTRPDLCTGAGNNSDLNKQHQFVATVVTEAGDQRIRSDLQSATGKNSAYYYVDLPANVAQASVIAVIAKPDPHNNCR